MTLLSCLLLAIAAPEGGADLAPAVPSPPPLVAAERPDFSPTPRSARLLSPEDVPAAAPAGPAMQVDPALGGAASLAERRRQLEGRIAVLELERPASWPRAALVVGALVGTVGLVVGAVGLVGILLSAAASVLALAGGLIIGVAPGWVAALIAGAVALAAGVASLVAGAVAGPQVARRQAQVDRELERLRRDRLRLDSEPGLPVSALPPPATALSLKMASF